MYRIDSTWNNSWNIISLDDEVVDDRPEKTQKEDNENPENLIRDGIGDRMDEHDEPEYTANNKNNSKNEKRP